MKDRAIVGHVWSRLNPKEKIKLIALAVLMLVGAGLEVLGIGLVVPFVMALGDPAGEGRAGELLRRVAAHAPEILQGNLPLFFGSMLLLLFLAKNSFLVVLTYLQAQFVSDTQRRLSHQLFSSYMSMPYARFTYENPSLLQRNVSVEVSGMVSGLIVPGMTLINEVLVLLCVLGLLFALRPDAVIVSLAVMGGIAVALNIGMRNSLEKYGNQRLTYGAELTKWLNQGLGSFKEAKVLGRELFFLNQFEVSNKNFLHSNLIFTVLNALPRPFIEVFAVITLLLVLLVTTDWGASTGAADTLPILALFAMAAVRLMPSLTRIVASLGSLRYYAPTLSTFNTVENFPKADEMNRGSEAHKANFKFLVRLRLKGVGFRYNGSDRWALRDLHLDVPKGSSVALTGASGAGKSTLADIILGLLTPNEGQVLVDSVELGADRRAWQQRVGYVPQSIYLLDDSIRRNVAFGVENDLIDDSRVWDVLGTARLDDRVKSDPQGLDAIIGDRGVRLSGGERQRLGIARALYHDPELLLLDEATSALDNKTEREITDAWLALKGKKTVVIIAHRLSTVRTCDKVVFLRNGTVFGEGSFEELYRSNASFRDLAGTSLYAER